MSEINIGAITEALNDKTDRDLRNVDITAGGDAVIAYQMPNAGNNYTWYRKYASGWVEQGGIYINTASSAQFNSIALSITMDSTNYFVSTTCVSTYASGTSSSHAYAMEKGAAVNNLTTTTFEVFTQDSGSGTKVLWEVKGMAAS